MLIEAGVIAAVGAAWIGKRTLTVDATTRRLLRREPACPIVDLADTTRAKITGVASKVERLYPAPFLETDCLAWVLSIHGNIGGRYREIVKLRSVPAFQVEDETGVARVDGRVEALAIKPKKFTYSKRSDRSALTKLTASLQLKGRDLDRDIEQALIKPFSIVSVRVGVLNEGDQVAVHGLVALSVDKDPSGAYRERKLKATLKENRATGLTIAKL